MKIDFECLKNLCRCIYFHLLSECATRLSKLLCILRQSGGGIVQSVGKLSEGSGVCLHISKLYIWQLSIPIKLSVIISLSFFKTKRTIGGGDISQSFTDWTIQSPYCVSLQQRAQKLRVTACSQKREDGINASFQ